MGEKGKAFQPITIIYRYSTLKTKKRFSVLSKNNLNLKTRFHLVLTFNRNKARYTATEVACEWAGAIFEVTGPFGQGQ